MAKTGRAGGRQGLEHNRSSTPQRLPGVQAVPESDRSANASVRKGTPNTNRVSTPQRVPETFKDVPTSGGVSYPSGGPNTNRKKRGAT